MYHNSQTLDQNQFRTLSKYCANSQNNDYAFTYNTIQFDQHNLHIFAGLCAVDTKQHVEATFKTLQALNLNCTRMGAYKPRTSPYSFQGHGKTCLPMVFELAGKYNIKVIAMEVMHERHIAEINQALEIAGNPTGVLLQIGTRNAQNFELLKACGQQQKHPVLYKRGFSLTIAESLQACEYIAHYGNSKIIFCLRGVKTELSYPHRNLVDFIHVPVVKNSTSMPVAIDPSHSVGIKSSNKLNDIYHATAQGVIAGANLVLVDFHPEPQVALVDSKQALGLEELENYLADIDIVRKAYLARVEFLAHHS